MFARGSECQSGHQLLVAGKQLCLEYQFCWLFYQRDGFGGGIANCGGRVCHPRQTVEIAHKIPRQNLIAFSNSRLNGNT